METSTTTPSFQLPGTLIRFLRFTERWLPFLSFFLVKRFFFRPIPFPLPEREEDFARFSDVIEMEVDGKPFQVHRSGGGRKVICIHGWSGRGTQFYALAPFLEERGFDVFCVTAPGHGSHPSGEAHMLEFTEALGKVWDEFGPFEIGIAHSIGGAAILNSWSRGKNYEKLVIMGTPSHLSLVIRDFCNRLGLSQQRTGSKLIRYMKHRFGEDFESHSPAILVQRCQAKGLVIHDKDDLDVEWTQGRAIHDSWTDSAWYMTQGLGHRRILSDPKVMNRIADFINEEV
ncbi:MAG: alpha/beta hydrolase [Bacteroidota bacterium]|nr:alpha/beta hydrolase [Bacteroidota bacterium]